MTSRYKFLVTITAASLVATNILLEAVDASESSRNVYYYQERHRQ